MTRGGASVELVGLRKRFGDIGAVEDLTLKVEAGEFVTILGPSGSGKTTTLMMVAGFEEPSAGEILIRGESVLGRPPYRRNIGVVFQSYALFPHMTVLDNVAYPLVMRKVSRAEVRRRSEAVLALVRLEGFGGRHPRQLSGGQQQRVALARALVFDPPLLLMDEPLGALDKKLREELQLEIKRVHREVGVTVIYVTHDQSEALTMSDRIAVMHRGRLEQYALPEGLYERPATRFVADFVGEAALLDGWVEAATGDGLAVRVAGGAVQLVACAAAERRVGERVTVVLRPEKLRFVAAGAGVANAIGASVGDVVYLGETTRYWLQIAGGVGLALKAPSRSDTLRYGRGDRVEVSIDPRDVIVVAG